MLAFFLYSLFRSLSDVFFSLFVPIKNLFYFIQQKLNKKNQVPALQKFLRNNCEKASFKSKNFSVKPCGAIVRGYFVELSFFILYLGLWVMSFFHFLYLLKTFFILFNKSSTEKINFLLSKISWDREKVKKLAPQGFMEKFFVKPCGAILLAFFLYHFWFSNLLFLQIFLIKSLLKEKTSPIKSSRAFLSTFFLSLFRSLSDVFFWLFVPIKNFFFFRTKKRLKTTNFFALVSLKNPNLGLTLFFHHLLRKPLWKAQKLFHKTFQK